MVGATPEEVRALVPRGWYVINFPDGRAGFKALAPGKLPGQDGGLGVHLDSRSRHSELSPTAPLALFLLNEIQELHALPLLVNKWSMSVGSPQNDVARDVAVESQLLLANKLVRVWQVEVEKNESVLLGRADAIRALEQSWNWYRHEAAATVESTTVVYFLDLTNAGRRAIVKLKSGKSLKLRRR
jgi:hypothetical protein